jgi:hypothetical protein
MKSKNNIQSFGEFKENLNISDVSDSSSNTVENAKKFLSSFYWDIEEYDEGGYLGIDETELSKILVKYADSLK